MNPRRCGAPARGGAKRIRPSAPSSSFAQGIARCTRYTATVGAAPPHASAHSLGNAIIFIWGPNFEMLPAAHRTLGSTQPWPAKLSKMNPRRCGLRHGVARREFGPLLPALRSRRASLVVLDTLRRSVQLPTCVCSLHGEGHHLYLGAEF